ncbi:NAD(P)/FAD-dependent oxidoreductase [Flavobacterium psychrotolerans]|uniref:FAD-dependent oxidoreductase n=1 Tax=Flavobacterium psychrotolerans TaxID=2169410 RepID=A0A2U1JG68_9FLAO|nr:FAD-dependent oxidoreductase [Flavobacterium psychrotolerans]PWA04142.1 FAD-dependent oxidoreductase [Flavobacterium psychrotolerans]
MIDYLIVGSGLAGISFAEQALQNNKTVFVVDANLQNSSKIAGGLYNPVILKRFSKLWQAQEQLNLLNEFYKTVESKLNSKFDFKLPILRKFFSVEEQNNWFVASDKEGLSQFLSTTLISRTYNGIDSPYDFGEVKQTGYVDVALLLEKYKEYLIKSNFFLDEVFDYNVLEVTNDCVRYKVIQAKHILFAEGFGMHSNPYFNHLPLDGTKGELFIIKAPGLNLDAIINASVFILPLGNDLFKVGATYNWEDKTPIPTEEGRQELIDRIKEILTVDFEIVSHLAGVRPTVKDRKPLLGTHPNFARMHILNGLGTRGVMLGPAMAKALFDHIEFGIPLANTLDICRFDKK